MIITEEIARNLLAAIVKHGRPAEVDWTNRHIQILSEVKVNQKVILSDGPMKYQDILFSLK